MGRQTRQKLSSLGHFFAIDAQSPTGCWCRRFAVGVLLGGAGLAAHAASWTVAVVSLASDDRYEPRRLERGYPGHPLGRPLEAARLAAEEAAIELEVAGHKLQVKEAVAVNAQALPQLLAELKSAKVSHVLLDLPENALQQVTAAAPAALGPAILFNITSSSDALRGTACAAHLLHTYPSQQMLSDALAQYLASRSWRQVLLLQGPRAQDQAQADALQRASKRYGLRMTQVRPFTLSGDPRERDLANTRLLTNDKNHDVVAVVDSDGEFARTLPYNTQWPRPVVGANGLTALAWHPHWERNGGPQLTRRFQRQAKRPMAGQDWAAWAAVKAVAAV